MTSPISINYDGAKGVVNFDPNQIAALQQSIASGQMTVQQALSSLQNLTTSEGGSLNQNPAVVATAFQMALPAITAQLVSGMGTITQNGRTGTYNSAGNFVPNSTTTYNSTTTGGGTSTSATNAYTVKSGDTLSGIAAQNGTTVSALMAANPSIQNSSDIQSGSSINIPATSSTGGTSGGAPAPITTGDPMYDNAAQSLHASTTSQVAAGSTINQQLTLTPALLSQFIQEGTTQMLPQYQQAMAQEQTNIQNSLAGAVKAYQSAQSSDILNFQQALNAQRNTAAAQGGGFSTANALAQNQDMQLANNSLSNLDAQTTLSMQNLINSGAAQLGTGNGDGPGTITNMGGYSIFTPPASTALGGGMNNVTLPQLPSMSVNLSGLEGGSTQGQNLDFGYNPANYALGAIPMAYGQAATNAAQQFGKSYYSSAANNGAVTPTTYSGPDFTNLITNQGGTPTASNLM